MFKCWLNFHWGRRKKLFFAPTRRVWLIHISSSNFSPFILVIKYSHHTHQVAAIEKWKLIRSRMLKVEFYVLCKHQQQHNFASWSLFSFSQACFRRNFNTFFYIFKLFANKCLSQTKEFNSRLQLETYKIICFPFLLSLTLSFFSSNIFYLT